jgi:hypothetical protein
MTQYQRPWWLIVNKTNSLTTTVQEEAHPGERIFVVRGEPLVQGLAWLVWGPIAALFVVGVLVLLVISLDVRAQSGAIRGLVIIILLILPAVAWGIVALILQLLSRKHLQTERETNSQSCIVKLNRIQQSLSYQTTNHPTEETVPYTQIQQVKVAPEIGGQDIKKMRLLLETDEGPIVLLNTKLGTLSQKNDLAKIIEQAVASADQK